MAKEKINFEDEDVRLRYRHTTSHIMAQAVKHLWPDAKNTRSSVSTTVFTTISIWSTSFLIRIC